MPTIGQSAYRQLLFRSQRATGAERHPRDVAGASGQAATMALRIPSGLAASCHKSLLPAP